MTKSLISFILLFLFLLVVSGGYLGHRSEFEDEVFRKSKVDENITELVDVKHLPAERQRRGVGGLIVRIALTTLLIGSEGFQLWTALAEGCNIRQSICTDKAEIRRLEGLIEDLDEEYRDIYYAYKWKYLNLRRAMINNKYIIRYLNETIKAVETIGDIIDTISTELEVELQTMNEMYANGTNGTMADLISPVAYQLADIEKKIESLKHSQVVGLVIQRIIEIFLGKSIGYLSKVFSKTGDIISYYGNYEGTIIQVFSDDSALIWNSPRQRSFWSQTKRLFRNQFKQIGLAFRAVAADVVRKFGTSLPNNVIRWTTAAKKWSTLKAKLVKTFLGEKSTIKKIGRFFKHPRKSIMHSFNNFRLSKGQTFVQAIGVIVNAIEIGRRTKSWIDVANLTAMARQKYEKYYADMQTKLEEVKNETSVLNSYWDKTMTGFTALVDQFMNITDMANENTVFKDVIGLSGHPINTSDPFFNTDFRVTNETELKTKQDIAINFFKANDESMKVLQDKFRVQEILILQTKQLINTTQTIDYIYEFIRRIYSSFQDSPTIVSYSSKLTKKDVVCSAAMLLPYLTTYDFYPLQDFRDTKCNISDDTFAAMETTADNERDKIYLIQAVVDNVPETLAPSTILSIAKGLYQGSSAQRLRDYGANLEERDVVCQIATTFTNMSYYQYYDLTLFRPNCSNVDDARFAQMKDDVANLKRGKTVVNVLMHLCEVNAASCCCPSLLALTARLTEEQINVLIDEYKQENKPNCNYVEQNAVCSWHC